MTFLLAEVTGPRAGLSAADLIGVGVYLVITFGIVLWSSRKQEDTDDFFLGGRRMPWLAVGMSLMATLLSTISYLGAPGEMIGKGVAMFFGYLTIPFSAMVVLFLWVPFFMRLKMTSAYEYLEHRFNYSARLLAGFLFLLLRLGWMSLVMYTASLALSGMTRSLWPDVNDPLTANLYGATQFLWNVVRHGTTHFPVVAVSLRDSSIFWFVVTIGLSATVYTCVGGMRAAIWNDVLQFLMLFGGAMLAIGYVAIVTGMGPVDWWRVVTEHTPDRTKPIFFSTDVMVRTTIVTALFHNFFWTICTHGSDQVVLQRYFSTSSLASARRSYLVNAVSDICMGTLLGLTGLSLAAFYVLHPTFLPSDINPIKQADKVLPYFFAHQLPAGLGGVLLASFICDAMQTLVSGVNSIGAVATKDVFDRLFPQHRWNEMTVARILTIFVGLLVTAMAIGVACIARQSGKSIIDLMPPTFNMFLGPLSSLFFIGMFLPRSRGWHAIVGALCGLLVSIVWSWWPQLVQLGQDFKLWTAPLSFYEELPRLPEFKGKLKSLTFTLATVLPCLTSFTVAGLLGLFFGGGDHPGRQYTWLAVMRRPQE